MIKINLLPVRAARKKEATQRHLIFFGIGLVLVLLLCVVLFTATRKDVSALRKQNDQLQEEIDNLKLIIPEVEELEKTKQALEKKKEIIGNLRASKMGPVHMLDEIATRIPEKLWLTELTQEGDTLNLEGTASRRKSTGRLGSTSRSTSTTSTSTSRSSGSLPKTPTRWRSSSSPPRRT